MKRLNILFDMDNVLYDFNKKYLSVFNATYNTAYTTLNLKHYELSACFPGFPKYDFWNDEGFFGDLEILNDAVPYVTKMSIDHNLFVLSASAESAYRDKFNSLLRDFHGIFNMRNIFFASRKDMVRADILLDDKPENLSGFGAWPNQIAVKYNMPFNEDKIPYCEYEVSNMCGFYDLVCDFAKEKENG